MGLIRVSRKGSPSVPGSSMVNLCVVEVLLKFTDLSFLVALWTSLIYLNHHLINVGDIGMAKDSKCFEFVLSCRRASHFVMYSVLSITASSLVFQHKR